MDEPIDTGGNTPETPPLTFEAAYAADTSPVSDTPSSESTTPPAAGQPGAEQGSPQTTDDRSPYIPRARFDDVNGRLKDAEAWKTKFGWAEQFSQADLAEVVRIAQQSSADPLAYLQDRIAELQTDPKYGPQLRSMAARALAQGRTEPKADPAAIDLNPIAVELADGRVIQVHTSEQMSAREAQLLAQVDQKYAPALQSAADLKQEREQLAAKTQADTFATDFLKDVRKLPDFSRHEAQIKADLTQLIKDGKVGDHPAELRDAVRSLYITHALPTRDASTQSRQLDDLQRKAAASTGINPGSAAPTSPRRPKSFSDPSLTW